MAVTNRRRKVAMFGIGLAWFVVAVGCGRRTDLPKRVARGETPAQNWRIICGTPALAELVFALGAGDRVVGISEYTVWPPEALTKPRIGGWVNPDRERLTVLRPDIILTQGVHERLAAFATDMGVQFRSIPLEHFIDVLDQMEAIGTLLGVQENGRALRLRVETELAAVHASVAAAPPRRVAVLFSRPEGDMTSLTAIGPDGFLNELIKIAGGVNVFEDARGEYPQISKESLLMRQPEVIIELHAAPMSDARQGEVRNDWQVYNIIPAVRDGRIELLTDDFILIPGPRMAQTARRFAQAIHPECFHD